MSEARADRNGAASPASGAAPASPPARPAAILAAAPIAAAFLALFLLRFPPAAASIGRLLEPVAAATAVLLAAYAAGAIALAFARRSFQRGAGLGDDGETAEHAAVLVVGLPVLGTVVAVLAWTGVAIELLVPAAVLGFAAGGLALVVRRRPALGRLTAWDVLLLGPPVVLGLVEALSPVSSPDELVYKLAVPKAYLLFGGMIELPLNSYSYVSTALSHVSLAALALSGGIAAKLVHAVLFVAALAMLRRLGEELRPGAGPWVAAVVAWAPALMLIAGWAWVEWGMLALLLLSYRGWLAFQRRPGALAAAVTTAAAAGAAAVKYTALAWIAVFAVVAAARLLRGERDDGRGALLSRAARPRAIGVAAMVGLLVGGFFYARNWIWSGSPVAPFLLGDAPEIERYRSQGELAGWQEVLLGYDIVHRGIVDDALGVILPVCALIALVGGWRPRALRDLVWIGLAPLPLLIAAAPTSRLMLASLVPLAVVGAVVLATSWAAVGAAITRAALAGLAAVALTVQLLLVVWVLVTSHDPLRVMLGAESEPAYQARMRAYDAAYRWIDDHTAPSSRVLLLGENRSYALERPAFSAGNFDGDRLAAFLARHGGAEDLARSLRALGVSHVLVHWPWLRVEGRATGVPGMLEREYVLPLSQSTAWLLQDLVDRLATRRYQDDAYSIYELSLEAAPAPAATAGP